MTGMADKTVQGWYTEADVVIGFEELSERSKEYRRSRRVWLDPELDVVRDFHKSLGISFIVEIAGCMFRFYCLQDVWRFSHVRDRFCCEKDYFVDLLERGEIWKSGDVSVWMVGKEVLKL